MNQFTSSSGMAPRGVSGGFIVVAKTGAQHGPRRTAQGACRHTNARTGQRR